MRSESEITAYYALGARGGNYREVVNYKVLSAYFLPESEVMLYSTRFISIACDWSLAVLSAVSHGQKYESRSTKAKGDSRESAQDSGPGHMHLLPIKSPFGRFKSH